jgi:monoamine oxidase
MAQNEWRSGWTRRRFLEMVGKAGGAAAVYETMTALGLMRTPEAWAGPQRLAQGSGTGKTVLILGAGIGGLTAAYELSLAGYKCEILEAQDRAGGRSLTARRGSIITEESKAGVTHQECRFDEGLYLNMGPGRLPYHHRRVLNYCRELGVPLEVYVMSTTANLYQDDNAFGGKPQFNRQIAYDTQGHIAELLSKAIHRNCLNDELNEGDRDKLLDLLKSFGDLGATMDCPPDKFCGTTRTGCKAPLTVTTPCEPTPPIDLSTLLQAEFWNHKFYQAMEYEWQATLFQPVGGMDQIVKGFTRKIGHLIQYQSEVKQITVSDDGVEVAVLDRQTGATCTRRADYCISNIPLPVLQKIPANFKFDFKKAVDRGRFAPACKYGWQANERFWEADPYQIYGGISYTTDLITQMWYPSNDYFSRTGTLTGAYIYEEQAIKFGDMSLAERTATALKGAIKLHPDFKDPKIVPPDLGLSIAWQNIPYQRGGWADWKADSKADSAAYARLLAPDRRFHVVGDQVSTLPGWQEGAMMSAEHVIGQIGGVRPMAVPEMMHAPDSRRLAIGRD